MLEVKKLKDFMEERGIQEGEQFAIGQELNENYIVLTESPFKLKFEDILEKYHFEDGKIIENDKQ